MVAEKRDPPARPGGRTEKLETALRNALEQRNSEQSKRALAESQRTQLRETLEECLDALVGCAVPAGGCDDKKHILDAQRSARAALKATEEG